MYIRALFLVAIAACADAPVEPVEPVEAAPVMAAAVPATEQVEASTADAPAVDRGTQVFATHCAVCHGDDARGNAPAGMALDPPAPDLVGPRAEHLRGIPRRQIIEEGRPGTGMVAWKDVLSAEDLEAVYGFVHNLKHGPGGGKGKGKGKHGGGMGGGGGGGGGGR